MPEDPIRDIKDALFRDMVEGTIPLNVSSFSELHDYVDANTYVEDRFEAGGVDAANEAIEAVDAWLRGGNIIEITNTKANMMNIHEDELHAIEFNHNITYEILPSIGIAFFPYVAHTATDSERQTAFQRAARILNDQYHLPVVQKGTDAIILENHEVEISDTRFQEHLDAFKKRLTAAIARRKEPFHPSSVDELKEKVNVYQYMRDLFWYNESQKKQALQEVETWLRERADRAKPRDREVWVVNRAPNNMEIRRAPGVNTLPYGSIIARTYGEDQCKNARLVCYAPDMKALLEDCLMRDDIADDELGAEMLRILGKIDGA